MADKPLRHDSPVVPAAMPRLYWPTNGKQNADQPENFAGLQEIAELQLFVVSHGVDKDFCLTPMNK